jgi:signal peptidase I
VATALNEKTQTPKKRRSIPAWAETIILLAIALLVAAAVKTFFVQMFFVPSGSMEPLLQDHDRILVEKMSYWNSPVKRGDVVVFEDPQGKWLGAEGPQRLNPAQKVLSEVGLYPTGGHLVKRVLGVGGDHVKCCDKQGRVTVNGVPLTEKGYISAGSTPSDKRFSVVVPPHRLWVMGDNRANSADSRYHEDLPGGGTVPVKDVVGKVWAIVWPVDRWTHLKTPETFGNPALATSSHTK